MSKKILLIADNASVCGALQEWLMQAGYSVTLSTEGGDEGIVLAVTEAPDLILIDTDLPVINGWQVIKILKASTVTQHIPIISITVPTTDAEWQRVLESGCNACELKPIDRGSILGKIKVLTESISVYSDTEISVASTTPDPTLFPGHPLSASTTSQVSQGLVGIVDSGVGQAVSSDSVIVYVDDSPLDSQAMAKIIEGVGYGYKSISEPLNVLPTLLEIRPKLIFLDLVMPYTNGYKMCAQIRRVSTFKKIPIVIVTNNDGIIDRVRAKLVGASGFFSKPVKEEGVIQVLKKYLDPAYVDPPKRLYQRHLLPFV